MRVDIITVPVRWNQSCAPRATRKSNTDAPPEQNVSIARETFDETGAPPLAQAAPIHYAPATSSRAGRTCPSSESCGALECR